MGFNPVRHLIEHALFLPLKGKQLLLQPLTTALRNLLPVPNNFIIYNVTTGYYECYDRIAGAWIVLAPNPFPAPHAPTHEPLGADPVGDIDILGTGVLLSGHETRHRAGGADPLSHANLPGVTAWQHHPHYRLFLWGIGWNLSDTVNHLSNVNSTANRYLSSPLVVPVRCRIDKIGFHAGGEMNSGNFMLGVHSSDVNLHPEPRVCQTNAVAVAGLGALRFHWITPTTTPTVNPGVYWIGWICDTNYAAGVAGMRVGYTGLNPVAGGTNWSDNLFWGVYRQDVGAFAVPNPMVEVNHFDYVTMFMALRVTAL